MDPSNDSSRLCSLCLRSYRSESPVPLGGDSSQKVLPNATLCYSCIEQQTPFLQENDIENESSSLRGASKCCKNQKSDEMHVATDEKSLEQRQEEYEKELSLQPEQVDIDQQGDDTELEAQIKKHRKIHDSGLCKGKPEVFVFNEEPAPVNFGSLKDDLELEVEEESPSISNDSEETESQGLQQSSARPPLLPGAFAIAGPHLNSINEEDNASELLVEAYLVTDPEPVLAATSNPETLIVHAEPLLSFCEKYQWLLRRLSIAAILMVIIVNIVALSLTMPTVVRNKKVTSIVVRLSNHVGVPQRMAMEWILGANNTHLDPDNQRDQIAQRYILATLYYSTLGENWTRSGNFLSSGDECKWYGQSVFCSQDGSVVYIQLGKFVLLFMSQL